MHAADHRLGVRKTPPADFRRGVSGRRYYSPSQGRFLGRDPKGEAGGRNLYAFTENNPGNRWDYLGMNSPTVMARFVVTATRIGGGGRGGGGGEEEDDEEGDGDDSGGSDGDSDTDAPNKQLSKSDCDSLASKIANNQKTLQGIADRTAPPGPSISRQIWNQLETPGQVSGIARDVWENGYRVTKASLESAGVPMRQIYKNAAPYVNGLGTALTIKDVWQLGVDIHDRDGLGFVSHSAETLLGVANFTAGMNLVVLGARIGINSAISDLQQGVDVMEATSVAAANQATAYNVSLGQHNLQAWQQAYENGGCKRFEK